MRPLFLQPDRLIVYGAWHKTMWRYTAKNEAFMQTDIQPKYGKMVASCSCGNVIETGSTLIGDMHLDICSKCHPFYTGKQKTADTGGRIDRFNKRFSRRSTTAEEEAK